MVFARSNRRGAPALALIVTSALAGIMVLMNYSKSMVQGFTLLSTMVTAANLPLYLFAALALTIVWRSSKRSATPGRLVVGLLGTAYAIFAFIGVGGEPFLWALALAAAGLPIYLLMRRHHVHASMSEPRTTV
jgi:APA family basic amino acid/polyamine antiporter